MLESLKLHLSLMTNSPIDYLYSYIYSKEVKIYNEPYNPKSQLVVRKLVEIISDEFPQVKVHFLGSAALKISGSGDIDLFVACPKKDIKKVKNFFEKKFSRAKHSKRGYLDFRFNYDGFPIELMLIDPNHKHLKSQLKLFELLKKNVEKYKELKKEISGYSERDYVRIRMKFFNDLLKQN